MQDKTKFTTIEEIFFVIQNSNIFYDYKIHVRT